MKHLYFRHYILFTYFFSLVAACTQPEIESEQTYVENNEQNIRALSVLLAKPFDMLSEKELDQVRLQTGSITKADYEASWGVAAEDQRQPIDSRADFDNLTATVDTITERIWGYWDKVDIPGAVCGNNSPYKIFIMKSKGLMNRLLGYTDDVIIYFEPGGACWDYPSCTGQNGVRGAANPNGIPDNFMNLGDFIDPQTEGGSPNAVISPLILRNHPAGDNIETAWWNKVFIPYCTGDVFTGDRVATYTDEETGESITYHHVGAKNMEAVIQYLKEEFPRIDRLMVSGFSAGGVGALTNYHFIRKALSPNKSYLLNDSGPIFPAADDTYNQYRLHQKISHQWNTGYLIDKLHSDFTQVDLAADLGQIHTLLAEAYPDDPLAILLFSRDANFSAYSYARFYDLDEGDPEDAEAILTLWNEDISNLVDLYDEHDNLSYYIPYFRNMNESHGTTLIEFTGTEYLDSGIDAGDFIRDVLDGNPVESYWEPENASDAEVTDFWMELVNLLL